jgi:quercetin dioxygenase-like cupin family protein
MNDAKIGDARVIALEDAPSFWQPVPANGFIRNILNHRMVASDTNFSMGTQTVAPHCFIREHTHAHNDEIIHMLGGKAIARLDGVEYPLETGSTVFIGRNRKHHFINRSDEPFTFLWLMMPGGLDDFFEQIGKPRKAGEPAPQPFPRPENVAEIEARTVFGWADQTYNP